MLTPSPKGLAPLPEGLTPLPEGLTPLRFRLNADERRINGETSVFTTLVPFIGISSGSVKNSHRPGCPLPPTVRSNVTSVSTIVLLCGVRPWDCGVRSLDCGVRPCGDGVMGLWGQVLGLWGQTLRRWGQTLGLWGQTLGLWGQTLRRWGQTLEVWGQTLGEGPDGRCGGERFGASLRELCPLSAGGPQATRVAIGAERCPCDE